MVAGRLAVEQVMDLRYKLRMLGVLIYHPSHTNYHPTHASLTDHLPSIKGPSLLLGDNQSVITSCSIPSSNLKKKHNAIAYHRIREAVAAGVVELKYVKSKHNLADAMTKALPGNLHYNLWRPYLLKPLREKGEYQHIAENNA
jgi:hypothetical protein